ncbi:bacillithiol system redox-active protein YtxJ [Maribacter sp. 2210JD10-5]|uniref:bacillithiol system redox-active protein YtxJ n=1 Tax=Maribacter sp. 2210JD10-5 TaxID=3386272 RepID=UPI0039BCB9B0
MGLFNGLFGNNDKKEKKPSPQVPWIALDHVSQLEKIAENSKGKPQLIFKHSTTCGISRMVLNMFTSKYALEAGQMDLYFLDLHAHRDISNEVAAKFQVMHQSPQLLIIKNGVVVQHDSHGAIAEIALENHI